MPVHVQRQVRSRERAEACESWCAMKLAITGTRHGRADVVAVLDAWVAKHGGPAVVIIGDAPGVDKQASDWARAKGFLRSIYHADWNAHGTKSGPIRNQAMANAMRKGDHCLAFPDKRSRGTWDCVRRMRAAGVKVEVVKAEGVEG